MDYRHADSPVPFSTRAREVRIPPYSVGEDISVMAPGRLPPHSGTDDEIGCLIVDGTRPPETRGRHCRYCGEHVTTRPVDVAWHPGPYVAEYEHVSTRTVHCAFSWENGNLTGLRDTTASPCWLDECLSNDEHEASRLLRKDEREPVVPSAELSASPSPPLSPTPPR
jgi:hypothetical protein